MRKLRLLGVPAALAVVLGVALPAVGQSRRHAAGTGTVVKFLSSGGVSQPPAWASAAPKAGGLAVDADGNVYVSAWNPPTAPAGGRSDVAVFDRTGKFLRTWGVGIRGSQASVLATGPNGLVYATVSGGGEGIDVFTSAGKLVKTIGQSAGLQNVYDMDADSAGNVYAISDDPPTVVRLDAGGNVTARWPVALPAGTASPRLRGIAVAADGSVYVATGKSLIHLDKNGNTLADAPNLAVLLPDGVAPEDVDLSGGNLYIAGQFRVGDQRPGGLVVVTTAGKLVDMLPARTGDVKEVAVAGEDVYATGYPAAARATAAVATGPLVTRFNGHEIPTPRPGDSYGLASCEGGGDRSQDDLLVPFITIPGRGAAKCDVLIQNYRNPCGGDRIRDGQVFVGGHESPRAKAYIGPNDDYMPPGAAAAIDFPEGSVEAGSVLVLWHCGDRGDPVYEWKGEIVLHDPSGSVLDGRTGRPVKAASLRLEFSPRRGGPFGVPGPSGINPQVNPQVTSSNGLFGWNVADGFWRLRVRAFGYKPFTSPVYKVPPPVTGLKLRLVQDPAQQRVLIDPGGRVGSLRLAASWRQGRRIAGLVVRAAKGKVRRIDVRSKRFRTAEGIKLGSGIAAVRMAYPPQVKLAKKTPANVIRFAHATFTIKHGRVAAISIS